MKKKNQFFISLIFFLLIFGPRPPAFFAPFLDEDETRISLRMDSENQASPEKKREFRDVKEAEEYLQSLVKEREIRVGDFYGINITAYRYVNIFHTLGYIRHRIKEIDEEIERVKLEIERLKKTG